MNWFLCERINDLEWIKHSVVTVRVWFFQLVRTSAELNQTMYVEFYITVNDILRNSTLVVNFFEMRSKEHLEVTLAREVGF